ncbi:hypothetical protein BGW80DRAFT_469975 [Lactifluus volemus]|nr:hypothetical protein BGW80DRAFT_469975 [Lactifluus volemus]
MLALLSPLLVSLELVYTHSCTAFRHIFRAHLALCSRSNTTSSSNPACKAISSGVLPNFSSEFAGCSSKDLDIRVRVVFREYPSIIMFTAKCRGVFPTYPWHRHSHYVRLTSE